MNKVRISEIALEAAKKPKEVLDACEALGIAAKAPGSAVTLEQAEKLMEYLISGVGLAPAAPKVEEKPVKAKAEEKKPVKETAPVRQEEKVAVRPAPAARAEEEPREKIDEKPLEMARKKGGLTIVRKKNQPEERYTPPARPVSSYDRDESFAPGYGRHKVAADVAAEERRRKKEKKAAPATGKKEGGQRIELMLDRDLGSSDSFEDEMVLMPDLSIGVSDFLAEQARNQRAAKKEFEKAKTMTSATGRLVGGEGISRSKKKRRRRMVRSDETKEAVSVVEIPEDVRVYEFAEQVNQPIAAVIKKLFELGMMVTKNDFLGKDAIEILAEEFGVEVRTKDVVDEMDYVAEYDADHEEAETLSTRPPIVTIMGHVDHGKTSLLDYIRSARVADGEAGGITQHIGAYTVTKSGKEVTFIDTPGHEAFSEMRARGANATDIVIIVVAADDGVMPQTKEAISHAKAAKCPIIVAINKMDKPTANPDRVKGELAEAGLTPIDWGGDIECVGVSAKTGVGIENLLETILLQAELMDLKAEVDTLAKAVVIESSLEKGRGPVATVIVQNGTLRVGDNVVAGVSSGRIRAIMDDRGRQIKALGPSEAGEVVGLDSVPGSGDILIAMEDAESAKAIAQKRADYERQRSLSRSTKATLDDLHDLIAEGRLKRLPIILKADVQGTLEAIAQSLAKLRNDEVKVDIVHSAVGAISESDVALAGASEHAIIMGFHMKPSQLIKDKAKSLGVRIASYDVIYDLIEDVRKILGGMLSPITEERIAGKAEVRQVFDIPKLGRIAGCMVMDGDIQRGAIARVMRGEDELYKGKIETLKRFKDDVKEVKKGLECGIGLQGFNGIEPGDVIEVYKAYEVQAQFEVQ
ncbi:MAG: translation initiation factor IF-2 [Campylobacterales bacterium]